jgi:hypothetical protein
MNCQGQSEGRLQLESSAADLPSDPTKDVVHEKEDKDDDTLPLDNVVAKTTI